MSEKRLTLQKKESAMKFRTEVERVNPGWHIEAGTPLLFTGSCFAGHIVEKLRGCMWPAERPAGTLYNPESIRLALELTALDTPDRALERFRASLFRRDGIWLSWYFDSKLAGASEQEMIDGFLQIRHTVQQMLSAGAPLFVTFGTAWYYSTPAIGVVANCHKMPAQMFRRDRLDPDVVAAVWSELLSRLRERYPGVYIVLTVSPVRHVKDTLHGNQLSKASLLLAVDSLCDNLDFVEYFPAYEMLVDDLRDYRYYAPDLVHPGEQGVEYIWEQFCDTYMDAPAQEALHRGEKEWKRLNHRPNIRR